MKPLRVCLVIFGGRLELISVRLPMRIRLYGQICETLYLLINKMPDAQPSSEKVRVVDVRKDLPSVRDSIHPLWLSTLIWLFKCITIQARMLRPLFKISREVDAVIFYSGLPFVLPLMLVVKFLGKKIIVMTGGSGPRSFAAAHPRARTSFHILKMLERSWCRISDNIGVETESAIHFMGLDSFRNKISIYGAMIYIDTDSFRIKRDLSGRVNSVGYIGDLVDGKGVTNFVEAARLILSHHDDVKFLIVGDGPLFSVIKDKLESGGLQHRVELTGWIPHDEMPDYLNKLKLLVLPSYSEGLPGIILEAMACGTSVLATHVGGVPDVIKNGKTGFILEDNSPECIARGISRALEHPNLDNIIRNARELIEQNYTFEPVAKRYKQEMMKVLSR